MKDSLTVLFVDKIDLPVIRDERNELIESVLIGTNVLFKLGSKLIDFGKNEILAAA